jgi:DNA-3-methyladenine glycosylase I
VPEYDSVQLFEKLVLDGAQAGLSWWTILNKRENYREAYEGFDPERVARFDQKKVNALLSNPGIVRNKLKVASSIKNAQSYLRLEEEGIDFSDYLWNFVNGTPTVNHFEAISDMPARTALSDLVSKELKKEGFSFVGSTIVYAFLQAVGIVNDHLVGCPRHAEVQQFYR